MTWVPVFVQGWVAAGGGHLEAMVAGFVRGETPGSPRMGLEGALVRCRCCAERPHHHSFGGAQPAHRGCIKGPPAEAMRPLGVARHSPPRHVGDLVVTRPGRGDSPWSTPREWHIYAGQRRSTTFTRFDVHRVVHDCAHLLVREKRACPHRSTACPHPASWCCGVVGSTVGCADQVTS